MDVTNKQYISVNKLEMCPSNGAVIGIFRKTSAFYFICTIAPNNLPFSVGQPEDQCSTPNRQLKCITKTCPSGSLFLGFRQGTYESQGPCSNGFNGNGVTMLDNEDCHTLSGAMQVLADVDATWTQWRVCNGNSNDLYVVTEAVVTKQENTVWTLDSITCCRIRHI